MKPHATTSTIHQSVSRFRDLLDIIVKQEQEMLYDICFELSALPEGSLSISPPGESEKTYFSHRIHGRNLGITDNRTLIYQLARKRYLSIVGAEVETDLDANKKIAAEILRQQKKHHRKDRNKLIRNLLEEYAKANLDIARITMTPEQYRWMHSPFDSNPMNPEELIFETYSGTKVRSKSEQSIGNKLELYGIPYRYEQAMAFDVLWMDDANGEALYSPKTYYPDFTILLLNGEELIWEHLGRVDKHYYRAHNMEKLCAYRQSGEIDFRHLILTFEADLIRPETLDEIIQSQVIALGV